MKVGIMSMQRVRNYGSFLQAYGLKKVLENMGCQVQFVDYKAESSVIKEAPKSILCRVAGKLVNGFKRLSPKYRRWRADQIRLNRTFSAFCESYDRDFLPLLGVSATENYTPQLDLLVIGSDEVFNCTQAGNLVGYSRQLFGKDHKARRLISYAATFGTATIEKMKHFQINGEVSELLGEFDALSVRDGHSVKMVQSLCSITPEQHIDPVLLYDFPEVDNIPIEKKDYIVVYAYADRLSATECEAVRAFARKHNKKILSLGFCQPFCDEFVLATPLEVLAYVKHADYVITDTFHGTVFSIKYGKRFATMVRDSNRQKLTGLLDVFELGDHRLEDMRYIEDVLSRDFSDKAKSLLKEQQRKALCYLQCEVERSTP